MARCPFRLGDWLVEPALDRTQVSRTHARVLVSGTTATVEDLGGTSGTFLDGERVQQPALLANRDEIWIGGSVAGFRFLIEGEATSTEQAVT